MANIPVDLPDHLRPRPVPRPPEVGRRLRLLVVEVRRGGEALALRSSSPTVLREGPNFGIHVLAWCDTVGNLNRTFERSTAGEFELRILFQMSINDSSALIDSPAAGRLGENRGLYFNEEQGKTEKFRPYGLPDPAWLETARQQLAAKAKPAGYNEGGHARTRVGRGLDTTPTLGPGMASPRTKPTASDTATTKAAPPSRCRPRPATTAGPGGSAPESPAPAVPEEGQSKDEANGHGHGNGQGGPNVLDPAGDAASG